MKINGFNKAGNFMEVAGEFLRPKLHKLTSNQGLKLLELTLPKRIGTPTGAFFGF
jgi:hypothetical protein